MSTGKGARRRARVWSRIRAALFPPLDSGLERINSRLGFGEDAPSASALSIDEDATLTVTDTAAAPRSIFYAPDMDGQPTAGEVVWIWAPSDGPDRPLRNRALLVVGHTRTTVLGLIISPNPAHAEDPLWLDIGTGDWDPSGRQSWLRLDKLLEVPQLAVRRQGTIVPRRRFERVATRLRSDYNWS